jgi:hypothetical protein
MLTRPTLYRSTLVAAAVAAGCLGLAPVASAHEHGGHEGDRHGYGAPHGWHERLEHRGYGHYARPAYAPRPYWREPYSYVDRVYRGPYVEYGYPDVPPVVVYRPLPRAAVVYDDPNVSVMIHVPL